MICPKTFQERSREDDESKIRRSIATIILLISSDLQAWFWSHFRTLPVCKSIEAMIGATARMSVWGLSFHRHGWKNYNKRFPAYLCLLLSHMSINVSKHHSSSQNFRWESDAIDIRSAESDHVFRFLSLHGFTWCCMNRRDYFLLHDFKCLQFLKTPSHIETPYSK